MPTGTIPRPLHSKGYGFITPDEGGPDVFFHVKTFEGSGEGDPDLPPGTRVSYELGHGTKGPQATAVRLLDESLEEQPDAGVSWEDTIRAIVSRHVDAMTAELIAEIGTWS